MKSRNSSLWGILCLVLICVVTEAGHAESVFAVASHDNSKIKAYLINEDEINYQATIKDTESFGIGATGFCVWPEKGRMFVTYEISPVISWASTKTLSRDPDSDEFNTGVDNLAGMAVDETRSYLYVLTRNGGRVYTYTYDENENTLSLIHPNDPCYPEREYRKLEGIDGSAYDLALDEENGLCYVSNGSTTVRYYDTTDWALDGSIDMGENVAGIGIDPDNYLYGGYFDGQNGEHNYLLRYYLNGDPDDPETALKKDMDAIIMDITVDSDNGIIYTTTDRSIEGSYGTVEVYDVSGCTPSDANYIILTDTEYDDDFTGSKPGGIAIGPQYKPPLIGVSKIDDVVACVDPNDGITYTITVDPNGINHQWVTVIDYLPRDVTFDGSDSNYDSQEHRYTWQLGALSATDEPFVLELTVTVIKGAEPAGQLVNTVSAESDFAYNETTEETPVCCWGGDIIYVDCTATGTETGTSWTEAYTDLQDALARAAKGCGNQVWITGGVYSPGTNDDDTFDIPDGVYVYGGLVGNESGSYDPNDREFILQKTVLTGNYVNDYVVTMGHYAKLHGFTIEEADRHGVYGVGSNFSVYRSVIQNNGERGIICINGTVKVRWCTIRDNVDDGIYHSSGGLLHIKNSDIFDNGENGIYTYSSNAVVLNSNIHHNGWDKLNNYDNGIRFRSPGNNPIVRNCTIMRNEGNGIYYSGYTSYKPDIYNCIFYNNNYHDDLTQFYGGLTAHYSSVTNPSDPNSTDCTKYGDNNMKCDPEFAYININAHNLHLTYDSPCVDKGNTLLVETGELDIDGDARIDDTDVDMGSDEVSCTDEISNYLDWNGDGLVNDREYDRFAKAWLSYNPDEYTGTDPNETLNWDLRCDLNIDHHVNYADFAIFAQEWLWQACWRESGTGIWMMMGMAGGESMLMAETALFTPAAAQQQASEMPAEPSVEEQIEQIKELLDWLYEIKDEIDEDIWLNLTTSLEEMLKELEDSQ